MEQAVEAGARGHRVRWGMNRPGFTGQGKRMAMRTNRETPDALVVWYSTHVECTRSCMKYPSILRGTPISHHTCSLIPGPGEPHFLSFVTSTL